MTDVHDLVALEAAGSRGTSPRPPGAPPRRAAGAGGRRWPWARTWLVLWVVAVAWSLHAFTDGHAQLLNPAGAGQLGEFWAAAASPDLSPRMLRATAEAALTTLALAVLGTALSVLAGLVLGVLGSRTVWAPAAGRRAGRAGRQAGHLAVRGALGVPRGVHEAVWALLLVAVLGRDPLVGVLAIAIPFGAVTAKVYAEMIDEADHAAYDALRAAGAGRLAALCYGLLPGTLGGLTSYACYRFECSVRSAVVLGMIGTGGLGFQLSMSFAGLQHEEMWTSIYAVLLLAAAADRWGAWLRRGSARWRWPVSAALAGLLGVVSLWHLQSDLSRWFSARTWRLLQDLVGAATPPRLPDGGWERLWTLAVETFQISLVAATLAGAGALLVAVVAARPPRLGWWSPGAWAARAVLLVCRAVPPPLWALLVLFVVLPGPLPGALALGIYTFGVLGRLFAEVVEDLDHGPRQALELAGASRAQSFAYATVPTAAGQLVSYGLYRWEVAVRDTVLVGVVGAGGLGRLLEQQRAAFDLDGMAGTVLALVAVSLLVDALSGTVRRTLR